MIKIGPSGIDPQFNLDGYTNFLDMPKWLNKSLGLNLCEYPFTYGANVTDEFCKSLAIKLKENNVEITAHAPYYVNYGNPDSTFGHKGDAYIISSLKKLKLMGGRKLCVHVGSQGKIERNEAIKLITERLKKLCKVLDENNMFDVVLCFEVMGKYSQIGNLEEIVNLAKLDKRFNITLDVGHLNCLLQGRLKTEEDFLKVFNFIIKNLPDKFKDMHIHYSKIMYNQKGEVKHVTIENEEFGPEFEPMVLALKKLNLEPTIICESRGQQAMDSVKMLKIWNSL